jgi:hypothetical protein
MQRQEGWYKVTVKIGMLGMVATFGANVMATSGVLYGANIFFLAVCALGTLLSLND